MQMQRLWRIGSLSLVLLLSPMVAAAQSPTQALLDNLDGQHPVLRPLQATNGFTISHQSIDRKHFKFGSGAERIHLRGPAGRTAQLAYQLPPAPVIQELQLRAHVLSSQAGIQLAAKVVLPRSIDRSTGHPYELLVRSNKLGAGGNWEEITLENLPQTLANYARVARAKHGAALDERGAYVSQIVFLVPGGAGITELIVDQIQVYGVVGNQRTGSKTAQPTLVKPPLPRPTIATDSQQTASIRAPNVPRIIQWQGESFQFLKQLGFNTIGMGRLPSSKQLQEAKQLGLFLFCPPPPPEQLNKKKITAEYEPVLAWDLGQQFSSDDLTYVQRWEQLVQRHDPLDGRPTVLAPHLHTLEASRIADVVLIGRTVIGTKLTVRQHAAWLAQRQRLTRPGTPVWTTLETQLSHSQQLQVAALSTQTDATQDPTYTQISALTAASFGIRTAGFYFQSQTSLATDDPPTRRRALALELTNLRLQLAEPWLAAGKEISAARSSQPQLSALVMQAERSHLLVPVWWSNPFQPSATPRVRGPLSFVVPSVAESSEAFLVTLGGLQRVRHQRVTGGIRISLAGLPLDSFLLLSDDAQAISQITRYLRRIAPRATKIRRDLANLRLQDTKHLLAALSSSPAMANLTQLALNQAQTELAACDRYLSVSSFDLAYQRADAVEQLLDQLDNELQSQIGLSSVQSQLNHGPLALPDQLRLYKTLARAPLGASLLAGGGFEDLPSLLKSGWRHQQLPLEGITSAVRLSPEAPHSGSYCLELEARSLDENAPTSIVPTAPVWISSAPLRVQAGDLLEITGVARLPEPLIGSVDGLQIIDSLGGHDMALRIHEAPSWQPFRLIRTATADADVSVTIALSGLGKAQIDDVTIRVIQK